MAAEDTFATEPPPLPAPLAYETPLPRTKDTAASREMWLGVFAGFFISVGVGSLVFGVCMAAKMRDDDAAPIAFGVGFLTLGASLVGLMIWLRRGRT